MRPGQQPMQYCSSFEGGLSSSCSSITLLDQQSLSQAWIECGNNLIKYYCCSHNRNNRPSEQSAKCNIGQALLLTPTGLLTLPGEDWSPPGKRPRNSYMTNLDGQCQGGPEGEKYLKTTGTGKMTKKKEKSRGDL